MCNQKLVSSLCEAVWKKALTNDQLHKRGFSLTNRCYILEESEETLEHLLVHCIKTKPLWVLLLSFFGVLWVWVNPESVWNTLLNWERPSCWQDLEKNVASGSFMFILDNMEGKE